MKCPACGTGNPDTSKYCSECGAALVKPAEDLRKVTVVFSDLSGYTAMSEHLGPEQTKAITSRIFSEAAAIAKRFDGRLDRLVGDCALVLFGIPRLHEDDAVRALRTALELHVFVDSLNSADLVGRIGRSLAMHTGVNTGTVLAGPTVLEAGIESVVGDSVNIASRLKDAARPGEILAGEDTRRLTAHLFDFDALPGMRLKGKAETVEAHRLLGVKASHGPEPVPARGAIRSPLVGRDEAVGMLRDRLCRLEEGRGSIVFVLGEAGVGKSRLVAEVREQLTEPRPDRHHTGGQSAVEYLEGHSLSYGRSISYWPFQEIVKAYSGIREDDGEEQAWQRLEERVRALFNGETEEMLPYLAALLAMEPRGPQAERVKSLSGEVVGHRIYLACRRFFQRAAERNPLMLVFEDLHWIDQSSALLLEHLLPVAERFPLLICCVSRPEPGEVAGRVRETAAKTLAEIFTEVRLEPLSRTQSERMTGNLLDMTSLGPAVREQIVRKAEGNPFYLEEIVRSLIDAGAAVWNAGAGRWQATEHVQSIVIPDSIQGVIMSRVDRLGDRARQVLRTAAVIGRSFLSPVLRKVMEAELSAEALDLCLAELAEVDIIRQKQRQPEVEFAFTHAVAQEAVYESILHQSRRELHARVGQAIESLFAERVEEFYGLLAYHYAQAESWEKARQYLLLSGDQAEHVAADSEALVLYEKAMTVYLEAFGGQWDPLERAIVERKMGEAFTRKGENSLALEHFMQAFAYLGKPFPGDPSAKGRAILVEVLTQIAHRFRALAIPGKRSLLSDTAIREEVEAYESVGWVLILYEGPLALLCILRMLNSSERSGYVPGMMSGYAFLSMIADSLLLPRLSDFYARKALRLLEQFPDSGSIGMPYTLLAIYANERAQWNTVRDYAGRAIEAYQREGRWNIRGWRMAIVDFADAAIHEARYAEALSHAQDLVRLGQDSADPIVLGWGQARQGYALKGLGRLTEAVESLSRAMECLRGVPEILNYIDSGGEVGQCHLRRGDIPQALAAFKECERLRDEHGIGRFPVCTRYVNGMAEAYLMLAERGEAPGTSDWLQKAGAACTEALKQGKAYLPGMPEAMMLRGSYDWLRGRRTSAERWWGRSWRLAEKIGVPYEHARTLFEMGRRTGDREQLERARALFVGMDAQWDLVQLNAFWNSASSPSPHRVEGRGP